MSESRGIGAGPNGKEGKQMKDSDVQHEEEEEEEEEEAKDVSEERNPSVVAVDQKEFDDEMTVTPSGEEEAYLPFKKRKRVRMMTRDHDQTPTDVASEDHEQTLIDIDVMSESETRNKGEEIEGECECTSLSIPGQDQKEFPRWLGKKRRSTLTSLKRARIRAGLKHKVVLFEKRLTPSDMQLLILHIPKEKALAYFPSVEPSAEGTLKPEMLQFVDNEHKKWRVKFLCSPGNRMHRISEGWKEFATAQELLARDLIWFCKHNHPVYYNHFFVVCVEGKKTGQNGGNNKPK